MAVLEIAEDRHFCVKKYCDFVKKTLDTEHKSTYNSKV